MSEPIKAAILKQWHPKKNNMMNPENISAGSHKRVWWLCEKGHEWQAAVYNRGKGRGCPYCAGQKPTKSKSLFVVNRLLAGQWHPNKNDTLTPHDIGQYSRKKVWWLCENGHEWKCSVGSRARSATCPICKPQKRNEKDKKVALRIARVMLEFQEPLDKVILYTGLRKEELIDIL